MMEKCPAAFSITIDTGLYQTVRTLLGEMARVGNSASRDHERMIQEIENLFPTGSAYTGPADGMEDLIGWSDCGLWGYGIRLSRAISVSAWREVGN